MFTSELTFREIRPEDLPAIFDVRVATWHNERGREEMAELGITPDNVCVMLRESHRGWLCEVDSRVVEFAMGNRDNGEMWVIAVLPECEGRGIGRRLMELVTDWLWDFGHAELWLVTGDDPSLRAYGFYKHLGWKEAEASEDEERVFRLARPAGR